MEATASDRPSGRSAIGKWGLACIELAIAVVSILILNQIQEALFRDLGTQLRSRTDMPVIYAVDTRCDSHPQQLPDIPVTGDTPEKACTGVATVFAVAANAPESYLFVNGAFFSGVHSKSAKVIFRDIPLRRGFNKLEVFTELPGPFPLPTQEFPPSLRPTEEWLYYDDNGFAGRERHQPNSVWLRFDEAASQTAAAKKGDSPNDLSDPHFLGFDPSADGLFEGIPGLQFEPKKLLREEVDGVPDSGFFQSDGFSPPDYDGSPPNTAPSPQAYLPQRSLTLEFLSGDRLSVKGAACFDKRHPFVRWASDGQLAGPELILRLFNVMVFSEDRDDDARKYPWSVPLRVGVREDFQCTTLTAHFTLERGRAFSNGVTLRYPQDSLSITGADPTLKLAGALPREDDGKTKIWRGRISEPGLKFSPTQWDSSPEVATPVIHRTDIDTSPFGAWQRLVSTVPGVLSLSTTAALPILLILLATRRRHYPDEFAENLRGPRAALVGALAFVCVFALAPVVEAATRLVLATQPFGNLTSRELYRQGNFLPAPLALIAVFSIVPLLGCTRSGEDWLGSRYPRRRLRAALVSMTALAIGVVLLSILRLLPAPINMATSGRASMLDLWLAQALNGHTTGLSTYGFLAGAWLGVCLLAAPFSVYWLMRALVPRVPVIKAALVCSALIFLLPALGRFADFFAVRVLPAAWVSSDTDPSSGHLSAFAEVVQSTYFATPIIVFSALVALLVAFRAVLCCMLPPEAASKVRAYSGSWVIGFGSAIILASIVPDPTVPQRSAAIATFDLLWHFQSYMPLLAMVAVVTVTYGYARMLATTGRSAFEPSEPMDSLIAAVFVGYLAIVWSEDAAGIIIIALAGWASIKYLVMDSTPSLSAVPRSAELASRLIKHIEYTRLLQERREAIEKRYASGDSSSEDYDKATSDLSTLEKRAGEELGVTEATAKRALFTLGPEPTPLQNAKLGAIAGLVAAVVVLLFSKLDLFGQLGKGQVTHLLSAMFRGGQHYEFPFGAPPNSPILLFLHSLIQTIGPLVIAGGLFGFAFHRIRGRDGFTKALVFCAGCAIPFLIGLGLQTEHTAAGLQPLTALAPFALFFIVLGSLVFDGWTLHTLNVGFGKLIDLYGFKTSVGYASVAGLVAGVQPLLMIIDHLFPGNT